MEYYKTILHLKASQERDGIFRCTVKGEIIKVTHFLVNFYSTSLEDAQRFETDEIIGFTITKEKQMEFFQEENQKITKQIESAINLLIQSQGVNKGIISNGYHTFDELYEHRIANFIALCKVLNTKDGEYFRNDEHLTWRTKPVDGWFVLGIHREKGKQITYHLPESKLEEVKNIAILMEPLGENFDGHTGSDVLERLKAL